MAKVNWLRRAAAPCVVLAALGPAFAAASPAAEAPAPTSVTLSPLAAARLLMQSGHIDEAEKLLNAMAAKAAAKGSPDDEVTFLQGLIAVQRGHHSQAISRFRQVLAHHPRLERARLELARALFLDHRYDEAERQFRFARAGHVPAETRAIIDQYLATIRVQRRWSTSISASLAPDSNVNAGPGITSVTLFGLPFQLSSQARQSSGVGFSGDASVDWSPPIGAGWRWRMGGQISTLNYTNPAFDDTSLGLYGGLRRLQGRWDVSVMASGFQRWYGGDVYARGEGVAVPVTYTLTPRLGLMGSLSAMKMHFAQTTGQDGWALSAAAGLSETLDPSSRAWLTGSFSRQNAQLAPYAYRAWQASAGYARDLPAGFTASLSPAYLWLNYDGAQAAFGAPRQDRQWRMEVSLTNPRWLIHGFAPRITYAHTSNRSDIALYAYTRDRVEMGLSRAF